MKYYEDKEYWGLDIEGNGLMFTKDEVSKVWIIALENISSGKAYNFHDFPNLIGEEVTYTYTGKSGDKEEAKRVVPTRDGTLLQGAQFVYKLLKKGDKLAIHNGMNYDMPLLHKFFPKFNDLIGLDCPIKPWDWGIDTLLTSRLQHFDRTALSGIKGTHGLAAWGKRLTSEGKPDVKDWSECYPLTIVRCIEDINIQCETFKYLKDEFNHLKLHDIDMTKAVELEHKFAYWSMRQEKFGARIDVDHAKECVEFLKKEIDVLRKQIEPLLPPTVVKPAKVSPMKIKSQIGLTLKPYLKGWIDAYNSECDNPDERLKYRDTMKNGKPVKLFPSKALIEDMLDKSKPMRACSVQVFQTITKSWYTVGIGNKKSHVEMEGSDTYDSILECRNYIKSINNGVTKGYHPIKHTEETTQLYQSVADYFGVEVDSDLVGGYFSKIGFEQSKMSQHAIVKEFLLKNGWIPTDYTLEKIKGTKQDKKAPYTDKTGKWRKGEVYETVYPWKQLNKDTGQMEWVAIDVHYGECYPKTPKITEDSFDTINGGIGELIAKYNTYEHRLKFIQNQGDDTKGLLNILKSNRRIPAGVNTFGTATGRSSQYSWVNAPSESAVFGKETRQLVVAGKGNTLLGIDMNSAQLAIAGYYAGNKKYYDQVCSGDEYVDDADGNKIYIGESGHCANARAFGLISDKMYERALKTQDPDLLHEMGLIRKFSKGGSFATIFGASGVKVARTLKIADKDGEKVKNAFLNKIGLDKVIEYVSNRMKDTDLRVNQYTLDWAKRGSKAFMLQGEGKGNRGYIELSHGYYNYCSQGHKKFNYLDQGTESVAQKLAVIYLGEQITKQKLKAQQVLNVHDEVLVECRESDVEAVKVIMNDMYRVAAEDIYNFHTTQSKWWRDLKFPIDLSSPAVSGKSYYDCH